MGYFLNGKKIEQGIGGPFMGHGVVIMGHGVFYIGNGVVFKRKSHSNSHEMSRKGHMAYSQRFGVLSRNWGLFY